MPECFFAHLGGCEGRLVKAHLVPKQTLAREYQSATYRAIVGPPGGWTVGILQRSLHEVLWDSRCWRWMCGGPTGIGGHHGQFDAKQIRLDEHPADLLEYLREYDLEWMADRYAPVGT